MQREARGHPPSRSRGARRRGHVGKRDASHGGPAAAADDGRQAAETLAQAGRGPLARGLGRVDPNQRRGARQAPPASNQQSRKQTGEQEQQQRPARSSGLVIMFRSAFQSPFTSQHQIRRFVLLLAQEPDPTFVLSHLASLEGLERLSQILTWKGQFSIQAGGRPNILSFQRVVVPLFKLLGGERLCTSPLTHHAGPIYALVYEKIGFLQAAVKCIQAMCNCGSLIDGSYSAMDRQRDVTSNGRLWEPSSSDDVFVQVLLVLQQILQCTRGAASDDRLIAIVDALDFCWQKHKTLTLTPQLPAQIQQSRHTVSELLEGVVAHIRAAQRLLEQGQQRRRQEQRQAGARQPILQVAQEGPLDGPGTLSLRGSPRHDNDYLDIKDIKIAPTQEEALSAETPYLPQNRAGAPHHLADGTFERHLDTHFRLLREDCIQPVRDSLSVLSRHGDQASLIHALQVGRVPGLMASKILVFRHVQVQSITCHPNSGVIFMLAFEPLAMLDKKSIKDREAFWERTRRLKHGALCCLLVPQADGQPAALIFASVTSREIRDLAPKDVKVHPIIGISCRESAAQRQLTALLIKGSSFGEIVLLQTSDGFFSYEPILRSLKGLCVTGLPFSRYLLAQTAVQVQRTSYIMPGKAYDLSCLLDKTRLPANIGHQKRAMVSAAAVHIEDEGEWRYFYEQHTSLDEAQAQAFRHALLDEVCLIQGPPGTGKSYVGVKLVEALLATYTARRPPRGAVDGPFEAQERNEQELLPILCVCYTNHALDQFLEHLLDAGIESIVRIGSRSRSERIQAKNMNQLAKNAKTPTQRHEEYLTYRELDELKRDIEGLSERLMEGYLSWEDVRDLLMMECPHLYEMLSKSTFDSDPEDTDDEDSFVRDHGAEKTFQYWRKGPEVGRDVNLSSSAAGGQKVRRNRFAALGSAPDDTEAAAAPIADDVVRERMIAVKDTANMPMGTVAVLLGRRKGKLWLRLEGVEEPQLVSSSQFVPVGQSDRPLEHLLRSCKNIWDMSRKERQKVTEYLRVQVADTMSSLLASKVEAYAAAQARMAALRSAMNLQCLRGASVVGMTTSGAAMNQALVTALACRVVVIEEAAEILEAHVLASLTRATRHLILIGDHKQLRPKTQVYQLSVESQHGFDLDVSLFERLVSRELLPTFTLATQRRMLPAIAELVRQTIYPRLLDHPTVREYPPVRGMAQPLFFFDHEHKEDGVGEDDSSSKTNSFEVAMIVQFAQYLLRQGYAPQEITILTPYLGQLRALRAALGGTTMVFVDERDEEDIEALADAEGDIEAATIASNSSRVAADWSQPAPTGVSVVRESLSARLRLATVDNFQGEESEVIIISLVRNNRHGQIGFLNTSNRINVLLSRARHGMYLFGHAASLKRQRKAPMWPQVLDLLQRAGRLGPALPLQCPNHPDTLTQIAQPNDFARVSEGGCSHSCQTRLSCGHTCPLPCHPNDPRHLAVHCPQPCMRLRPASICPERHPCPKACGADCGPCRVPYKKVLLPGCGHEAPVVQCGQLHSGTYSCSEMVTMVVPQCGHKMRVHCFEQTLVLKEPSRCSAPCGQVLACGHICKLPCGQQHTHEKCSKPCERNLHCGHVCIQACHPGVPCGLCKEKCLLNCVHAPRCDKSCGAECSPCLEPCPFTCPHRLPCPFPCGVLCARLPCGQRCAEKLACKHRCPGLCGEPCVDPAKGCRLCCPKSQREVQVDLITLATLQEHDPDKSPLLQLPCGHVYTVETLDGMLQLDQFFELDHHGSCVAIRPLPATSSDDLPRCPQCRAPVVGIARYARILTKALLDLTTRNFCVRADQKVAELKAKRLGPLQRLVDSAAEPGSVLPKESEVNSAVKACHRHLNYFKQSAEDSPLVRIANTMSVVCSRLQQGNEKTKAMLAACLVARPHVSIILTAQMLLVEGHALAMQTLAAVQVTPGNVTRLRTGFTQQLSFGLTAAEEAASLAQSTRHAQREACFRLWLISLRLHYVRGLFKFRWLAKAVETEQTEVLTVATRLSQELLALVAMAPVQDLCKVKATAQGYLEEAIPQLTAEVAKQGSISKAELRMVLAAVPESGQPGWNSQGHWFTCPNGHPYMIGDCGGAMVEERCPECGLGIGGAHHRLRDDNQPFAAAAALRD